MPTQSRPAAKRRKLNAPTFHECGPRAGHDHDSDITEPCKNIESASCSSCHRLVRGTPGGVSLCANCNRPVCVICTRVCLGVHNSQLDEVVSPSTPPGNGRIPFNVTNLNVGGSPVQQIGHRRKLVDEQDTEGVPTATSNQQVTTLGCGRILCRDCCVECASSCTSVCYRCADLHKVMLTCD